MKYGGRPLASTPPAALSLVATWLGLGAAGAFLAWIFGLESGGAGAPESALRSYGRSLLVGLGASGVVVALGSALGQAGWLVRASYASCVLYAAFLATLGWPSLPWLVLVAAVAVLVLLRHGDFSHAARPLLLLHAMGTFGALYASFHLGTFLAAWPRFREDLGGLWLVLTSIGS